jgi:hypothetical protein
MELKHGGGEVCCRRGVFCYRISSWVSAEDSKTEIFDVFLCHNSDDKPAVREIAQQLVREGIKPWLDEEQIRTGIVWQVATFGGEGGFGPCRMRRCGASQPICAAEMFLHSDGLGVPIENAGGALEAGELSSGGSPRKPQDSFGTAQS